MIDTGAFIGDKAKVSVLSKVLILIGKPSSANIGCRKKHEWSESVALFAAMVMHSRLSGHRDLTLYIGDKDWPPIKRCHSDSILVTSVQCWPEYKSMFR